MLLNQTGSHTFTKRFEGWHDRKVGTVDENILVVFIFHIIFFSSPPPPQEKKMVFKPVFVPKNCEAFAPVQATTCDGCGLCVDDENEPTWSMVSILIHSEIIIIYTYSDAFFLSSPQTCSCHGSIIFHGDCGSAELDRIAKKQIRNTSGIKKRGVEERVRQQHYSRLHECGE